MSPSKREWTTIARRELERAARRATRKGLVVAAPPISRPKTRAECPDRRPCPFFGCRYNLFADATTNGGLKLPWGEDLDAWAELPDTCALDVAARGAHQLEDIGRLLNLTRERVRQIEMTALEKLRAQGAVAQLEPGNLEMADVDYDRGPTRRRAPLRVLRLAEQKKAI